MLHANTSDVPATPEVRTLHATPRTTEEEVDVSPFDRVIVKAPATSSTAAAGVAPAVHVDLLTVSEAAQMLRVSDGTIRNWIAAGSIPYIQLPPVGQRKQYRIPLQGLLGSLEGNYDLRAGLQEQNARMREADLSED